MRVSFNLNQALVLHLKQLSNNKKIISQSKRMFLKLLKINLYVARFVFQSNFATSFEHHRNKQS